MLSSPILGKGSWFPQTSTGIGSIGSPDQCWGKILWVPQSSTGKSFYRFPSPILGKGSRFPSSVLEKVLGSKVQNWEKVL